MNNSISKPRLSKKRPLGTEYFDELVEMFSPFYKNHYPESIIAKPDFKLLDNYSEPTFILNFTTTGYSYANKAVELFDIEIEQALKDGFSHTVRLFLDNEKQVLFEKVLPRVFSYVRQYLENNNHNAIKASYCTHIKLKTGEYQWYNHELTVLGTDPETGEIIGIKQLKNIEYIKKDNDLDFHVFEKDKHGIYRVLVKESFDLGLHPDLLSDRELTILSLIRKGKTSKEISCDLCISEYTVNNHRKNMLRKTHKSNMAELLGFALSNGILGS